MDMLEIDNPEKATERFMEIMIEERVDPMKISDLVFMIMKRIKR